MIDFVQGSTFNQRMVILLNGLAIGTSDWTMTAVITNSATGAVIDTPTCTLLDGPNGVWQMTANSATTQWPPCKASLAAGIVNGAGETVNAKPAFFRIIDTPLAS